MRMKRIHMDCKRNLFNSLNGRISSGTGRRRRFLGRVWPFLSILFLTSLIGQSHDALGQCESCLSQQSGPGEVILFLQISEITKQDLHFGAKLLPLVRTILRVEHSKGGCSIYIGHGQSVGVCAEARPITTKIMYPSRMPINSSKGEYVGDLMNWTSSTSLLLTELWRRYDLGIYTFCHSSFRNPLSSPPTRFPSSAPHVQVMERGK